MAPTLPARRQAVDEIDRLIRESITGRIPLRAIYNGGGRLLCPQMLGRNKEGQVRILCLQIGGESASGLQRKNGQGDWRCLALEKFSRVEQAEEVAWQTAESFLLPPKCMDRIELEVTPQPEREPQQGH